MEHALKRFQALLGDTLQILDHMVVDAEHNQILQEIKSGLQDQNRQIEALSSFTGEERMYAALSMIKNLNELNNKVQLLEANLFEDYQKSTGHAIEQYEQMAYEAQLEQTDTYHDKIDYLSAVKIRENLNRMNGVLLSRDL